MSFELYRKKEETDSFGTRIFGIVFLAALCALLLGGACALRDVIFTDRATFVAGSRTQIDRAMDDTSGEMKSRFVAGATAGGTAGLILGLVGDLCANRRRRT